MARKFKTAFAVLECLILVLFVLVPASRVSAAADKLPDLAIARITGIKIVITTDGRRELRFPTSIVNIGVGAFEVRGQRPDRNTALMSTTQRIYDDAGGFRDVATTAEMFYSQDGHNHWHLKDLEIYELIRLDNGVKVGTGTKVGFCFYDTRQYNLTLPGAPQSRVYTGCGFAKSLSVVTGLSVGWGDTYGVNLSGQSIDITNMSGGRYRLQITSDPHRWFSETNESNNVNWVDLQLNSTGTTFKIVGRGPNP